jgi:prolipoprotein diacylglyceryltransferase
VPAPRRRRPRDRHAIGRIGCFLVGDDYGADGSSRGIAFPRTADNIPVHPTQL